MRVYVYLIGAKASFEERSLEVKAVGESYVERPCSGTGERGGGAEWAPYF